MELRLVVFRIALREHLHGLRGYGLEVTTPWHIGTYPNTLLCNCFPRFYRVPMETASTEEIHPESTILRHCAHRALGVVMAYLSRVIPKNLPFPG